MGRDAYALIAYGCELTETDLKELCQRLGYDDSDDMLYEKLKEFNAANDCRIEYMRTEFDCLLYVDKPSHYCGSRVSYIKTIGSASNPTLHMTIDDNTLAAIDKLKQMWPEVNTDWAWKVMTTYS